MTKQERELLGRIYRCVQRVSTLGPSNPADVATLARADLTIQRYVPHVGMAISSLGFGDYEDCAEYLDLAEAGLGIKSDQRNVLVISYGFRHEHVAESQVGWSGS